MAASTESEFWNLHECSSCHTKSESVTTAPCRHDFCTTCTDGLISDYKRTGSYSCAQCSQTFYSEPGQDLVVNQLLKMDLRFETSTDGSSSGLINTSIQTQIKADANSGAGDVSCDACADSSQKALSSCLVCLSSYCDKHLRLHNELHARAAHTHTLVEATHQLQDLSCSVHGKVLEIYCREEKQRICYMCMLEDHKGHDVVAVGQEERAKLNTKQMMTEQENQLKKLQLAENTLRDIANATEDECERLFTELIRSISCSQTEIRVLIRAQEQAELNRIGELMKRVEEDILELTKSDKKQNDIHVLQTPVFTSANVLKIKVNPQFSFGEVVKSMSALKHHIENIWQRKIKQTLAAVMQDRVVSPAEMKTRKDFLKYLVPLTLDPDTAHRSLSICEEKRVECITECQPYPEHPERFDWWAQVLCREPLNARCYWEAEWTGLHGVDMAVSYRDIPRKGEDDECSFGYNTQSWSLDCTISKYTFVHDDVEMEISAPVSHRVGVYLDYKAGVLSFYSVSDSMALLHRVETRFTQPLYAAFGLFQGSTVKICQPDRKIPEASRVGKQ
ncbi:Tripartite motif-containing protein 16 [Bagarius yarrelli]|uniref:Tripartite motif-containing protein 16 n=1 Tax=Bagarius yarrelli TaxID=175774 RepID=A0A556U070_BAGYA|nr:Tripartite motif-containing protein 16 [Bagarius yarrelli]